MTNLTTSTSPTGEKFTLLAEADCQAENDRLTALAPGHSWSRFFRNQESLTDLRISKDLKASLKGVDAVILAVRHDAYKELEPEQIIAMVGNPAVILLIKNNL